MQGDQRGNRKSEGWMRLLSAVRPHAVDPWVLGEYASVLHTQGKTAASSEFPEVAEHLSLGCNECQSMLEEMVPLLGEELALQPATEAVAELMSKDMRHAIQSQIEAAFEKRPWNEYMRAFEERVAALEHYLRDADSRASRSESASERAVGEMRDVIQSGIEAAFQRTVAGRLDEYMRDVIRSGIEAASERTMAESLKGYLRNDIQSQIEVAFEKIVAGLLKGCAFGLGQDRWQSLSSVFEFRLTKHPDKILRILKVGGLTIAHLGGVIPGQLFQPMLGREFSPESSSTLFEASERYYNATVLEEREFSPESRSLETGALELHVKPPGRQEPIAATFDENGLTVLPDLSEREIKEALFELYPRKKP